MIGALIALLIVIRYKAKQGVLEEGIIKGTRIYGYIILSITIFVDIVQIATKKDEDIIFVIIDLIVAIILLVARIKEIAVKAMYKEDDWQK